MRAGPGLRVGQGFDLHRLSAGLPLILAGVRIPHDRGPVGHSDGDVLCHALCDAILGAAGAGDIGTHFPDDDPRWAGTAGLLLLARTVDTVRAAGFRVGNADATVILERPRLRPHVSAIVRALAGALGVAESEVSVKAKTAEELGPIGEGAAIAAQAIVLLIAVGDPGSGEPRGAGF